MAWAPFCILGFAMKLICKDFPYGVENLAIIFIWIARFVQKNTKKKYAFCFYSLSRNFRGSDVLQNIMKWRTLNLNREI